MNNIVRFFSKVLLVIGFVSICHNSYGQSNNCRAFYLTKINVWLGNTTEENKILSYAANNGFTYIIFYDLHLLDFNNNTIKNNIASFFSRARNNYGIVQIGACGETYSSFANKIIPYNNSRTLASEKFNVLNFEFEFWVQSTITQYYCSSYLQPGGYNCDTAGAWAYSFKQFKKIDSLCTANGLISEVYLGWPNKGQMQNLANVSDRILLHAYQSSDAGLYSYSRNRLIDAASINKNVNILPLFSSESSFMGPWLQTHPIYQPYQTYSNNFIAEAGAWKQYIKLQGYTWFYYPTMPQTTSGAASISKNGPTNLCLGDSIILTASSGASYLWSPGGETTQTITVKQTGNYIVNVLSANGAAVTSAPVNISVGANQTPFSVSASGPISFCTGDNVTLTCSSAGPYLWSNGATESSITVNSPGDYSVDIQSGNCVASSIPVNVTVFDKPEIPIIISDVSTSICPGSELILNTTASGNLLWSTGDTNDSIVVNTTGSFWLRVFSGPGCYSESETTTVSFISPPPVPIVTTNEPTTFCDGDSISLTSTEADEYQWSNGETTQSITVKQSGNYFVSVTTGECNSVLTSLDVTINVLTESPQIIFEGLNTFCKGDSVKLKSNISADSYLWSNGATTESVFISQPETIQLTIQSSSCSFTSDPVNVYETNAIPNPTISVNGPTSLCQGQSVTLTSSPAASYLWSDGSTTSSITVSQPGVYSVLIQSGTCSANSDPLTIDVNNSPEAPVITPDGPLIFCAGNFVTLSATPSDSYLWSNGATTSSIQVTQTGNYSVAVQNGGCNATSTITNVTVDAALPVPVINASGPLTFCKGGSVTLTASAAPNYTWSNGSTTSAITITESGTYSVTVFQGTCNNFSTPKSITVNPIPPKPVITASGSTSLCSGQSVTLTSSSLNSNVWSNNATTASIVVTQAGNYTVKNTIGGCLATSDPKSVSVTSLPSKPTISANGSLSICPGSAVTLTSSASSQNLWSTGATTRSIVVSGAGSYWVKVTQNGCSSTQSNNSTVAILSAPAKPTITITGSTTLQNSSSSVTLKSSSATKYLWSNNATTQSIIVKTAGVYRVTVYNSSSCTSTSNDVKVTTKTCTPPTAPTITLSGSSTLQPGQSVVLTSSTASGYLWSTGATTKTISVSAAGTYTVRAFSAGNCYSTSLPVKIYVISSRLAASVVNVLEDEFKAYPNPAHENISFSFYSEGDKKCILKLFDLNGREVEMHTINSIDGMNTFELNLSNNKKGFYIACLMMDDKSRFLKIIVE